MTGLHRGVRGKVAQLPHPRNIVAGLAGPYIRGGIGMATQQLQCQQRGMSFIHMILAYREAQGAQHAYAADAEHDLLFEPVGGITAIQIMSDLPIHSPVFVQIGIQ
ncbi:hypothetical protein BMS3Abin11_01483 [bacterium BMS3Abin11]|nr:hypothetical protein BMS3Abin11_01483 [bacterium BMS3Abin11]